MPTIEELTASIRDLLTSGDGFQGEFELLEQSISSIAGELNSTDPGRAARARLEAEGLLETIAELTTLGENRLEILRTDLAALVRQDNLQRRYGLTSHG